MGLSNSEFATIVGCHVTTASRWRNGHRLPEVKYLEAIRVALGLTWVEVYEEWSQGTAWADKYPRAKYPDRSKQPFGAFLREHVFDDDATLEPA
jgi:transcriptional regulator with XRE-family HTH domain